jgi:7,8-dihydropterin-6-yl-methyl-4-(beta-D-ribofuranosyl)aminobenzene 5'-phosphate synthase
MISTLLHAQRVTGVERILGVAGGTHLGYGGEERLKETIAALRSFEIEILAPSHCTGSAAASALSAQLPDRFIYNCVGTKIVL